MTSQPLLSINIPTYNRLSCLKEALASLLPQVTDEVEINITDNHSTDGTWDFLETLSGKVNRYRPRVPLDANYNILSCAALGRGTYTWIHCDDDIAIVNAVENIIKAINAFDFPPALCLQWQGYDPKMTGFVNEPVLARWKRCDKNEFLRAISYKFTFASAIITKRGCPDLEYIKTHAPRSLIPGNIIFSTVGKYNDVVISEDRLLGARGSAVGSKGDVLSIFSRQTRQLFRMNKKLGYDKNVLDKVYNDGLEGVVAYGLRTFEITWKGLWNLIISSMCYRNFYNYILPMLISQLRGRTKTLLKSSVGKLGSMACPSNLGNS